MALQILRHLCLKNSRNPEKWFEKGRRRLTGLIAMMTGEA